MRTCTLVILFALIASLLFGGAPAQAAQAAYPVTNADALTRSPLYATGRLPWASCPERPVRAGDVASVRAYLAPLVRCLGAVWSVQLQRARIPFSMPRVRFITRPQRACGGKWRKDVQALYCNGDHQITLLLDQGVVDTPEDLFLLDVIAHEFGHHVQNLSGITRAYDGLDSRGKAEAVEQTRRHELQAECLAGVFIGGVWPSLKRGRGDWKDLLDAGRRSGDENSYVRDHGKGANIAAWLDRGFRAASPSVCNTWTASAAAVA
ncbi:neutral zinc metallopeptidase [Sphaerisporangium dianthi]|uniref:Neutral zinc metallopeptidase n=1 Tax=Sphaerisporangium dianthi TaxID=1436120 RepID=A0ABV9CGB1_9ACTN